MARDDADSWSYALDCATTSVKSFTACLQAIKLSKRCRARVRADARGVTFATMDESKSCGARKTFARRRSRGTRAMRRARRWSEDERSAAARARWRST